MPTKTIRMGENSEIFPTGRTLRICIIGAGVSGICAGVQLKEQLGLKNFVIFDENAEVGGTWFQNVYPGCACDVPSHLYSFSFAPNPNWSSLFAPQKEILEYLKGVTQTYGLYQNIKFNYQVRKISWDENIQKWKVLVKNKINEKESEQVFDIVISGVGGLRVPNIPTEFDSFKGVKVHSAEWNPKIQLDGKRVGVVGSGASAVQIIPSIVEKVEKLIVFQRRSPWVIPRIQIDFPKWLKRLFETVPALQTGLRAFLFCLYEMSHSLYIQDSRVNLLATKLGAYHLNKEIEDKTLKEKLRPNYSIGCKRVNQSELYYAALKKSNVELTSSKIQKVNKGSITTEDSTEHEIDILILATGFKVQDFFAPMKICGKKGEDIFTLWKKEGPSAYLGICTYNMPNCFFIFGPNSAPGNTSAIFSIECQVGWIIKVISEMLARGSKEVSVDEAAEKEYMRAIHKDLKSTVWGAKDCGNWYVDHRGVVTALNPYSGITYWMHTRKPDFSKLNFK